MNIFEIYHKRIPYDYPDVISTEHKPAIADEIDAIDTYASQLIERGYPVETVNAYKLAGIIHKKRKLNADNEYIAS